MHIFSSDKLSRLVSQNRRRLKLSQAELSRLTGMNRATISRIEQKTYTPSIPQLQELGRVLGFDASEVFTPEELPTADNTPTGRYNIAVAGTGYVGLSIATLLSQHHHVTAVDIIPERWS